MKLKIRLNLSQNMDAIPTTLTITISPNRGKDRHPAAAESLLGSPAKPDQAGWRLMEGSNRETQPPEQGAPVPPTILQLCQ